jgi:hypothetical protein
MVANSKHKESTLSDKYQVIIAENAEVLLDCMEGEGDTSAGESFFADSLKEAERILDEHTAVPGKGGVIIPPKDSNEVGGLVLPMRTRDDIEAAACQFCDKVWYDRHQCRQQAAPHERAHHTNGDAKNNKVVDLKQARQIAEIQRGAAEGALKMEAEYGKDNLGPYTDFEWGMINGKLSALRWVLGDEWDMLDT